MVIHHVYLTDELKTLLDDAMQPSANLARLLVPAVVTDDRPQKTTPIYVHLSTEALRDEIETHLGQRGDSSVWRGIPSVVGSHSP